MLRIFSIDTQSLTTHCPCVGTAHRIRARRSPKRGITRPGNGSEWVSTSSLNMQHAHKRITHCPKTKTARTHLSYEFRHDTWGVAVVHRHAHVHTKHVMDPHAKHSESTWPGTYMIVAVSSHLHMCIHAYIHKYMHTYIYAYVQRKAEA
jgi:hypothetical protein